MDPSSTILRHAMRETDSCGPFGSEEFVAVLPATPVIQRCSVSRRAMASGTAQ
ncbi:MAG TPA: hypothetical protein VM287_01050 [Egibacteraceae bacterium]|nr:hypothetical protein [Egibacteraceae bacterium]